MQWIYTPGLPFFYICISPPDPNLVNIETLPSVTNPKLGICNDWSGALKMPPLSGAQVRETATALLYVPAGLAGERVCVQACERRHRWSSSNHFKWLLLRRNLAVLTSHCSVDLILVRILKLGQQQRRCLSSLSHTWHEIASVRDYWMKHCSKKRISGKLELMLCEDASCWWTLYLKK